MSAGVLSLGPRCFQPDEMKVKDAPGREYWASKRGMARDQAIFGIQAGSSVVIQDQVYEVTQGVTDWIDTPRDFVDRLFNR